MFKETLKNVLSEMRNTERGGREFLSRVRREREPRAASSRRARARTTVAEVQSGRPDRHQRDRHKRDEPPNLTYAIVKTFIGIAFVFVALAVRGTFQIAGQLWWFWMLIPAAGSLGSGIAEFVRLYQSQQKQTGQLPQGNAYVPPPIISHAPRAAELPPQRAGADIYRPSSVTENTTKLLEKDQ